MSEYITIKRAELERALEALDIACRKYGDVGGADTDWGRWDAAITALRAALAQQALPMAWVDALKDAFFEGFTSVATYNDTILNSPEEAWANYKLPHIALAQPMQKPVGRVVSAYCEYATVQWLKQTSDVGGGDPKNSRSWPIAGDAVYIAPPHRKPLTEEEIESCRQQGYSHAGLSAPFDFGKAARAIERKMRGDGS